jgi:hypothetical protein
VTRLTSSQLSIQSLNRKDYSQRVYGSDRIFYGKYPYKIALIDTNVQYDISRALEMLDWWDMVGTDKVKFVSNLTRHFYFTNKQELDFFVSMFADQIKEIKGPISNNHVQFLIDVNDNKIKNQKHYHYHGNIELIIRNKLWHGEHDMKVEVGRSIRSFPAWQYSAGNTGYGAKKGPTTIEMQQSVKETCKGIVDKYRDSRWNYFYCDSKYADDIKMFVKLKHPNARLHLCKALVEKNL